MSKTIEEQVEEFDHFLQNSGNEVSWGAIDKKMTAILQERDRIARDEAIKEERNNLLNMIGHIPYVSEDEYQKYKNGGVIKWVTLNEHFNAQPKPNITSDKTDV